MENSFFHYVIESGGALILLLFGGLMKSHNKRIDKLEADNECTDKDLNAFKLDSEKRFAKEETMQQSLLRIHTRLDELPKQIRDMLFPTPGSK